MYKYKIKLLKFLFFKYYFTYIYHFNELKYGNGSIANVFINNIMQHYMMHDKSLSDKKFVLFTYYYPWIKRSDFEAVKISFDKKKF